MIINNLACSLCAAVCLISAWRAYVDEDEHPMRIAALTISGILAITFIAQLILNLK